MREVRLVVASLFLLAGSVHAEDIRPGAKVRVSADGRRFTGLFVGADEEALRMNVDGDTVSIPRGRLASIEIGEWRPAPDRGAQIGAGAGLALGLLAVASTKSSPHDLIDVTDDRFRAVVIGASVAVGAAGGALLGLAIGRTRWTAVDGGPVRVGVVPVRGGFKARVAVGF